MNDFLRSTIKLILFEKHEQRYLVFLLPRVPDLDASVSKWLCRACLFLLKRQLSSEQLSPQHSSSMTARLLVEHFVRYQISGIAYVKQTVNAIYLTSL